MAEARELSPDALARIEEAARWQRCWRCMHAPCSCPAGEGLGRVPAAGGALGPVRAIRLRQDPEQVVPGSYRPAPKKRRTHRRGGP